MNACTPTPEPGSNPTLPLAELLPLPAEFAPIDSNNIHLPADHQAHEQYRLDVWTILAWLQDKQQQPYTLQFTILRIGLQSEPPVRKSNWAVQQLYGAELKLFSGSELILQQQKLSRSGLGLAGTDTQKIWLDDWQLAYPEPGAGIRLKTAALVLQLNWQASAAAQPVTVFPGIPQSPVGYIQAPLPVTGRLQLDKLMLNVNGQGWFEHVWGNGLPMGRGQLGLVQIRALLKDDHWLHCAQLQRRIGGGTALGGCTRFDGQTAQTYDRRAVVLSPQGSTRSWQVQFTASGSTMSVQAITKLAAHSLGIYSAAASLYSQWSGKQVTTNAWLELAGWPL